MTIQLNEKSRFLKVYTIGEKSVIGLIGSSVRPDIVSDVKAQINGLLDDAQCTELCVDLGGITAIPSEMVGYLGTLPYSGVKVRLFNASREIREAFAVTCLDRIVEICGGRFAEALL